MPCLPTSLHLYEEIIKHCLCEMEASNSSGHALSWVPVGVQIGEVFGSPVCYSSEIGFEAVLKFVSKTFLLGFAHDAVQVCRLIPSVGYLLVDL